MSIFHWISISIVWLDWTYLFAVLHWSPTQNSHFTHSLFLQSFHWITLWPEQLANKIELIWHTKNGLRNNTICIRTYEFAWWLQPEKGRDGVNEQHQQTIWKQIKKNEREKTHQNQLSKTVWKLAQIWQYHFTIHTYFWMLLHRY